MAEVEKKQAYGEETGSRSPELEAGEITMNADEAHLASLGYKQEFFRSLGIFENWAATFTVGASYKRVINTCSKAVNLVHELHLRYTRPFRLHHVYWRSTICIRQLDHGRRILIHCLLIHGRDCRRITNRRRNILLGISPRRRKMGSIPQLDDGLVELDGLGVCRTGCSTRVNKLPIVRARDPIPGRGDFVKGLVRMAPDKHRNAFCHGTQYHLTKSTKVVFPLRHFHILHPVRTVLDMVPDQGSRPFPIKVWRFQPLL
jgi:hypothetical protein